MPELSSVAGRTLNELRTIQYLEETVGPAGLRRLAEALPDDESRDIVQEVRRLAASASLELESIIEDWNAHATAQPRTPRPLGGAGLGFADMVESFIEVKRSSAELLRRAARNAPNDALARRLVNLSEDEDSAAQKLSQILPATVR